VPCCLLVRVVPLHSYWYSEKQEAGIYVDITFPEFWGWLPLNNNSLLLGEQTQIVRNNITIDSGTVKYALHWSNILWLCTVLNAVYRRSNYSLNDIFTSPYRLMRSCSNTRNSLTCCTKLYETTIQHVPLQTNTGVLINP
jgi:hypothetical protein